MFRLLLIPLLVILSACGSANEKVEDILPSGTPAEEPSVVPEATDEPTSTARPTAVPTVADNRQVTVERQGFQNDPDGTSGPSYAIVLKNQSSVSAVEGTDIQIAFYDSAGTVLGTETEYLSFVQPGEVTAVAGSGYITGAASEMRIQIHGGDWSKWENPLTTLTAVNISISYEQYIGPKVTGEIVNPFTKDLEDVQINVVFYDSAGTILGGDFTYLDFVPAGGQAAFDVSHFGELATLDHVEVYPQVSSLTLLALD